MPPELVHKHHVMPQDDTVLIRVMEALLGHLDRIAETAVRLADHEEHNRTH
jgi:hypothetical protein